jgi:hypothetical protein
MMYIFTIYIYDARSFYQTKIEVIKLVHQLLRMTADEEPVCGTGPECTF